MLSTLQFCDVGNISAVALALAKGERTRARLLEAAVRRFALDGYRTTSLTSIARDAGVTPAAVYGYFPGKEALFDAAVDLDAAALIDEALEGLGDAALTSAYSALLPNLLEGLGRHPLAERVLAGREPEVIGRLLTLPALLELRQQVAEAIVVAQRDGRVRTDLEPREAAVGLESIVLGLLMASLQVGDTGDERAAGVLAVLDAVLRAPSG